MKCANCGLNLQSINSDIENSEQRIISYYACPMNDYSIITYYNGNILERFNMLLNLEEGNNLFVKVENHTEYVGKARRAQYKQQYALLLVDDWELVKIKHLMPIGSTSYKCDCNLCNEG